MHHFTAARSGAGDWVLTASAWNSHPQTHVHVACSTSMRPSWNFDLPPTVLASKIETPAPPK